jgi:hypothetical protein
MSNPVGRPKKYQTKEELSALIEEYFNKCDNRVVTKFSAQHGAFDVKEPEPYTMSGLAYWLGIDRDTLLRYSKEEEFYGTIKEARARVHADVERRLMETNPTGAIFNLKNNFGWVDKTESEVKQSTELKLSVEDMPEDKDLLGLLKNK